MSDPAPAPDVLSALATWLQAKVSSQKSAAYLRNGLQAWINMDVIPWVNSAEGAEAKSLAVGALGNLFGGLAEGGIASGLESATDADILKFIAIVVAVPPANDPTPPPLAA